MLPTRRQALLFATAASLPQVGACAAQSATAAPGLRLITRPQRVFKIADLPRERTEAWFVLLIAESAADVSVEPSRVTVTYSSRGADMARVEHWGEAVRAMTLRGLPAPQGVTWPFALRLISRQPAGANIDRMHVVVAFSGATTS